MPIRRTPHKDHYSDLLRKAMHLSRLTPWEIAKPCEVVPRTVRRWEMGETEPNVYQQRVIVYAFFETGRVPHALLEELAEVTADTLESLGLVPHKPTAPAPSPAPVPANAKKAVDDALREAADDLDMTAKVLRPIAAKLLDALARAGVPVDVAAHLMAATPKPSAR